MKRKILFTLIIFIGILILFNLNTSKAATFGKYTYEVKSDGTVKITDYNTSTKVTNLNIPSTIDGKKVTEIGERAFEYVEADTVTVPNTVTIIWHYVFSESKINKATIPSSVTRMDTSAFYNSTIETADIQANMLVLSDHTFSNCKNLKNVKLSPTIRSIYSYAFENCTNLSDLSFLSNVEQLSKNAFKNCPLIKNVVISNKMQSLAIGAFDPTVNVDISNTRLTEYDGKYMIISKLTIKGTYYYDKAFEVLNLVNEERRKAGLEELVMDEQLLEGAMQRAAELKVLFSHDRPNGRECASICEYMYGENIHFGTSSPEETMQAWMGSYGHRDNILTKRYKSIGVGCFQVNGIYYWVQCFGTKVEKEATKKSNYTGERDVYAIDEYINLNLSTDYIRLQPGKENSVTRVKNSYTEINPNCVTWNSSNPEVATIDKNGKIKGIKNGTAEITATLGPDTKRITVFVQYFDDINKADWYTDSVNYCYNKGIILGTGTKYNPNTKLTRGMLVTILHRMEGKPTPTTQNKFKDVYKALYYYDAIRWATEKGIVHGYDDESGNFGPEDNVTRQDLAVILRNYAEYKGKNVNVTTNLSGFSDSNLISDYAKTAMQWAVGKGVINGNDTTSGKKTLTPHANSSRAEAAAMIYNYCTKVKDKK